MCYRGENSDEAQAKDSDSHNGSHSQPPGWFDPATVRPLGVAGTVAGPPLTSNVACIPVTACVVNTSPEASCVHERPTASAASSKSWDVLGNEPGVMSKR